MNILSYISAIFSPISGGLYVEEEEILRVAVGRICVIIGILSSSILGSLYVITGEKVVGLVWISQAIILACGSILLFKKYLSTSAWLKLSVIPLFPYAFVSVILLGGLAESSAIIIWATLPPMVNITMFKDRDSRLFFTLSGCALIGSAIIPHFFDHHTVLSKEVQGLLLLGNVGAYSLFVFVIFQYVIVQRDMLNRRSEELLLNLLPKEIIAEAKNNPGIIAQTFDNASVLFADLVKFTALAESLPPIELVELLNSVVAYLDGLVEQYGLEKIHLIGDCYMVAAGVPIPRIDHAQAVTRFALEMRDYLSTHEFSGRRLQFRIGINSGFLVGGVVGKKRINYDIWGDTVNLASRMESHGIAGSIQITEATYRLIKDEFILESKGFINIKGKGMMPVWHVVRAIE